MAFFHNFLLNKIFTNRYLCFLVSQTRFTAFVVSHLVFPEVFLTAFRNDWFAEDLVDIVLGEARTKVEGGFLGIFFTK